MFILLHEKTNRNEIRINLNYIEKLCIHTDNNFTRIYFGSGHWQDVIETPEEIDKLIYRE